MSLKHLTVCSFKNIFKYICVCLTVIFSRGGLKSFYVLCKSNQIWSGKYNKTKMLWKIGAFLVLGKLHPSFRLTYGSTAYISNPKLFENLKIVLLKKSLCEKKKKVGDRFLSVQANIYLGRNFLLVCDKSLSWSCQIGRYTLPKLTKS